MASAAWADADTPGRPGLSVRASATPTGARVWVADAATQDFRKATWTERPAVVDNSTATAAVDSPSAGFRAFFVELDYDLDGLTYHVCSGVRVLPPAK